ncbi:hypothetical protein EMPS_03981 [Entomortierella parvispora]|uniref:Uncharacterized protein n=1 Tax=Entomortierella parvispora TaxID=205924 RepID=A0A9P3H7N2_9FUNG|nr:hypothetical protein EMPS_03981 [Entomortierella parvispora]
MKFATTSTAVLAFMIGASSLSDSVVSAQAPALSAACNQYLTSLSQASNPLSKCRVYTALGFPQMTHKNDHDTPKLQKAIVEYCSEPACTAEQYTGVYKDLQTNCASDMIPANQATLGVTMYMWYMSPAQRDAICLREDGSSITKVDLPESNSNNVSTTSFACVTKSINTMILNNQYPNQNPNEDDLYGYLQFVTPFLSAKGTNVTNVKGQFCSSCNQQVANVFSTYYQKTPSPFPSLSLDRPLTTDRLSEDLKYQYKSSCGVDLGSDTFKPVNLTDPSSNKGKSDNAATVMAAKDALWGLGLATVAASLAGLMAI